MLQLFILTFLYLFCIIVPQFPYFYKLFWSWSYYRVTFNVSIFMILCYVCMNCNRLYYDHWLSSCSFHYQIQYHAIHIAIQLSNAISLNMYSIYSILHYTSAIQYILYTYYITVHYVHYSAILLYNSNEWWSDHE